MIGLALLAACLLAAAVGLGVAVVRLRRERAAALELLGAHDLPLPVAVQRELRRRVPREELSTALFSREAVLEAVPAAVLVFDADGRVVRANAAARESLAGAVPGSPASALSPALAAALEEVLSGPPVLERELVLEEPTRRTVEVCLRSHPDGERRSAIAVLVDVTASVDFREARRLFSAAVSHELRTPLARILGLAETLALPLSPEERGALVAQTEVEIENMRDLIDEMLLLSALDRGEVPIANDAADAGAVVEEVVADRRKRRSMGDRRLAADTVSGLAVAVPPRLLAVVIGNLVDNALRHAGLEANVAVAVRGLAGEVEFTVADTGVGIAAEHLPHVFERFYRGEASRAGPGTGLGLAVVKHIAEAYGGRVAAESRVGEGTRIRMVIPEAPAGVTSGA